MPAIMTSRQSAELDYALERNGCTPQDVKTLSEGENLTKVREFIRGKAEIIPLNKRGKFVELISENKEQLIGHKKPILEATDGKRIIADASDVFGKISPSFRLLATHVGLGESTTEVPFEVYGIVKEATFTEMFCSVNLDLRKLCFTQAQIIDFVVHHTMWMNYDVFMLFESNWEIFVAHLVRFPGADFADRNHAVLHNVGKWESWGYFSDENRRLVVPRIK